MRLLQLTQQAFRKLIPRVPTSPHSFRVLYSGWSQEQGTLESHTTSRFGPPQSLRIRNLLSSSVPFLWWEGSLASGLCSRCCASEGRRTRARSLLRRISTHRWVAVLPFSDTRTIHLLVHIQSPCTPSACLGKNSSCEQTLHCDNTSQWVKCRVSWIAGLANIIFPYENSTSWCEDKPNRSEHLMTHEHVDWQTDKHNRLNRPKNGQQAVLTSWQWRDD